ncbi:MAG: hypothetical protein LBE22_00650 [Azoarcus sp.]|jgi:hypothetical protein|nr:hypothetical protein [Azoarcus sp.]
MYAIRRNRLLIGVFSAAVLIGGCGDSETANLSPEAKVHMDRLNTWKLGDWLHDIDAAMAASAAADRGDLGEPTPDLLAKVQLPKKAIRMVLPTKCWPHDALGSVISKYVDTAHTDHACLDAQGYKRSK